MLSSSTNTSTAPADSLIPRDRASTRLASFSGVSLRRIFALSGNQTSAREANVSREPLSMTSNSHWGFGSVCFCSAFSARVSKSPRELWQETMTEILMDFVDPLPSPVHQKQWNKTEDLSSPLPRRQLHIRRQW